ncbi:MAG: 16S rRNA (cytosine(1402)-N(4))-methyltransferase RsmH [Kiritimatiellales bacterium]
MHIPVLLSETIDLLVTDLSGTYIDGTLGCGGHAAEILKRLSPAGRLIGMDRDLDALAAAGKNLKPFGDRAVRVHGNFAEMKMRCEQIGVNEVTGILLDLGVSSPQLDIAERGFSFAKDGPLDMRMDRTQPGSAAALVNELPEEELAGIIFRFGEEHDSRRIARAIVEARKNRRIETTLELAGIVEKAKGGRRGAATHPATQTFQALRMAVNCELESIERGIADGLAMLCTGGRMAVITFHSLEDRLVKEIFKRHTVKRESLQQGGEKLVYETPAVRPLTKKPLTAGENELKENPRARSAKLRVVEKEAA